MVFSATFNNISDISWRSVLLVEEIRVPGEIHRPVARHWQLYHNVVSSTPHLSARFELATLEVIGTDCYLFYPNWSDCIIGNIIRHKFVLWRFRIVIRFIKFITFVRCILYLRLRKMSHTIYAASGKVSHIHRRMC
jgi:hypothetical protein